MKRLLMILFFGTWGVTANEAYNFYEYNDTVAFVLFFASLISLFFGFYLLRGVEKEAIQEGAASATQYAQMFSEHKEREE